MDAIPPVFEFLRDKAGFGPKLLHDVHSHISGMNAVELARRLQPYQMFFVEESFPRNRRLVPEYPPDCTTPQAVGEVFSHPYEVVPLVTDRLIDLCVAAWPRLVGLLPSGSSSHWVKFSA